MGTYDEVIGVLKEHSLLSNKENCIIFVGMNMNDFDEKHMQSLIEGVNPQLEITFMNGQQYVYDLIIGLV